MLPHRTIRYSVFSVMLAALALGAYLFAIQLTGNFVTVVDGTVYRSNQVTPERLRLYQADYGIKTILNLRGASPDMDWYRKEDAAAKELGIKLIDFGLSARRELDDSQIRELVQIMKDAPKPLLIHCRSGADRTGLASALYLAGVNGVDTEVAAQQLSIRYGHFSIPLVSQAWPMDTTWERTKALLKLQ